MISGEDDRGVSELAGAVLIFAAIIITLSVYQAVVVPAQNERVEFDHNQRLQSDMQNLRQAILNAPSWGSAETVTIELGFRYPARQLLVNPAPPTGTLETDNASEGGPNISIDNAASTGEVGDYWDGSTREFETTALTYRPAYNQYTNAPSTNYENSVLYNRFNDTLIPLTSQSLIDDTRIRLVAVGGTLSRNGIGTTSINIRSISPGHRTISVTDSGSPIIISIPTRLDRDTWLEVLDGQFIANGSGGHIESISVSPIGGSEFDRLTIELEPGVTYNLQLAKVAVGRDPGDVQIGYLTRASRNVTSMTTDEEEQLIAEVRNRFNNPVSGVEVTFTTTNGTFTDGSVTTTVSSDTEGQASAILSASTSGEATVRAGIDSDEDGQLTDEPSEHVVTYTVFINSS